MKRIVFLIISLLVITCAKAQVITNYVKNPDFEKYDTCPPDINNQISYAKYWSAIDSVNAYTKGDCHPEYCNACIPYSISSVYSVPSGIYYQFAHSGNGMTHGYYFFDETSSISLQREYLQGRLYRPLTIGKSYCVSFYINLSEETTYATNKMGAYLDDGSIDTVSICSKPITHIKPQIYTNDVITDTLNWVKIEGSFTANGTERFITLGNFFPKDSVTYTIPLGIISHNWAYYLIDDVSVIESDLPADGGADRWVEQTKKVEIGRVGDSTAIGLDCKWYKKGVLIDSGAIISVNANAIKYAVDTYVVVQTICGLVKTDTVAVRTVGLGDIPLLAGLSGFTIYPNPSNGKITITSTSLRGTKQSLKVYDLLGREVHQSTFNGETIIQLNTAKGTYILELKDSEGNAQRERILIQ